MKTKYMKAEDVKQMILQTISQALVEKDYEFDPRKWSQTYRELAQAELIEVDTEAMIRDTFPVSGPTH
jgi:hypothetical protein